MATRPAILSREEERDLVRRYQAGDRAAGDALLRANAGMLHIFARQYADRDLEMDDAVQEVRLGFLRGVLKFDLTVDVRLMTYAGWWARQEVQCCKLDAGDIRLPAYLQDGGDGRPRMKRIRAARLDAPLAEEGDFTLLDKISDAGQMPDERLRQEQSHAFVRRVIAAAALSEREAEIVERRILADTPETLDAIGASFTTDRTDVKRRSGEHPTTGVSRERVRQLEAKALKKLERAGKRLAAAEEAATRAAAPRRASSPASPTPRPNRRPSRP